MMPGNAEGLAQARPAAGATGGTFPDRHAVHGDFGNGTTAAVIPIRPFCRFMQSKPASPNDRRHQEHVEAVILIRRAKSAVFVSRTRNLHANRCVQMQVEEFLNLDESPTAH